MTKPVGRTLMVVENIYPLDIRVRKEAESLTAAGYSVTVIALRGEGQKFIEELNGVTIYRIPEITIFEKRKRSASHLFVRLFDKFRSIAGYIIEYAYFTIYSFAVSLYILAKHGFDVIHTHNPPDTLSLVGIFYKALGKQYIFDHHDLSPELYLTRVSGKKDLIYQGLIFFERLSCSHSDVLVTTNESYRQIEISRYSVRPDKIFIVRNNPIIKDCALGIGGEDTAPHDKARATLLFLGSINPQDGVDLLIRIVHHLVHVLGRQDFMLRIIGDGDYLETAKRLSVELNVSQHLDFTGMITDREILKRHLALADIGVEPAPLNEVNRYSTFIKVMEYMAARKPVVAFDLEETRHSLDGAGLLVPPEDYEGFAQAIVKLLDDPQLRERLGQAGLERIEGELNWERAATNLRAAYAALSR